MSAMEDELLGDRMNHPTREPGIPDAYDEKTALKLAAGEFIHDLVVSSRDWRNIRPKRAEEKKEAAAAEPYLC